MKNSTKFWSGILIIIFIGLQLNDKFFNFEYEFFKFIGIVSILFFIVIFVCSNIFFLWMYLDYGVKCTDEGIAKWVKYFIIVHWIIIIPYEYIKENIIKFNNFLDKL